MADAATEQIPWRHGPAFKWIVAALIAATATVLGLWFAADATIRRDISMPKVVEVGAIVFNCEAGHLIGAQIYVFIEANGTPETEARACFDWSSRTWYLKNREQYVPFGK